ncbi:MAG: alpha/beta fold hydrolase [Oceanicaulis sp.]
MPEPARLDRGDGHHLGYLRRPGEAPQAAPGVMFLGGFASDMGGTKAMHLDAWAQKAGRAFLRFDYFGHGASSGAFEDATISRWRQDALAALDQLSDGPQILVGSSMGGWMALLAALARPERVKALVLIAPAPDFTEKLMWAGLPFHVKQAIETEGRWEQPSPHGGKTVITRALIEDGRRWSILDAPVEIEAPVRILQGWRDPDVPWNHAVRLMEALSGEDVELHLSKSGDHRLSGEADLKRLVEVIEALS